MHGVSLRRARLRAPAQAVCVFALVSVRQLAKPAGLPTRSFIDCGGQFWPGLRLRRTKRKKREVTLLSIVQSFQGVQGAQGVQSGRSVATHTTGATRNSTTLLSI